MTCIELAKRMRLLSHFLSKNNTLTMFENIRKSQIIMICIFNLNGAYLLYKYLYLIVTASCDNVKRRDVDMRFFSIIWTLLYKQKNSRETERLARRSTHTDIVFLTGTVPLKSVWDYDNFFSLPTKRLSM
jgi:hypothetical protein